MRKILSIILVGLFVTGAFLCVATGATTKGKQPTADNSEIHKFIESNKEQILQQSSGYVTLENNKPTFLQQSPMGGWAARAPIPTKRMEHAIGVVNNKIYVIGGGGAVSLSSANEEFDPATNTWKVRASMPTARCDLAIGVVNNKIYAIGGGSWRLGVALKTNEEYDPANNSWTTKAPMPTARCGLAVGVVNNKIYAIGGYGFYVYPVNEEYDPVSNTWATKVPMPTARNMFAIGVVNNTIYAIGGWSGYGGGPLTANEQYNPATNLWATKASMPTARGAHAVGVVNNKIYAIGGTNIPALSNEMYDPALDTWSIKTAMPTHRSFLAAGVVNNKIYVIGGDDVGGYPVPNNDIYAPSPPDLDISNVLPIDIHPNTTTTFNATIKNTGYGNAIAMYLNVSFKMDGKFIGNTTVQNINIPVNGNITTFAPTSWLSPKTSGVHTLTVSFYTDVGGGTPGQYPMAEENYKNNSASFTVNVIPLIFDHIHVTPSPIDVVANNTQAFIAVGQDVFNNTIQGLTFKWSTNVGSMAANVLTAQKSAGVTGYVRATNGTFSADATVTIIPDTLVRIKITPSSWTMTADETKQYTATGYDKYENNVKMSPIWSASNGTIDNSGLYHPVRVGIQIIYATQSGVSGTATVNVTNGSLSQIIISPSASTITADQTQQFTAAGYDKYGNNVKISPAWEATNGTINPSGLYHPWRAGIHTIYAKQSGVSGTATVTVTVGTLNQIAVSPSSPTITADNFQQFTASGQDRYGNAIPTAITPNWAVTNGVIDSNGLFHPNKVGTWTVYANYSGISGNTRVTVTPGQLHYITVSPSLSIVYPNSTKQFTAVGYDARDNAIEINPEWAVDTTGCAFNEGVLAVNSNAQVGVWTVYANQSGISGNAKVIIAANPESNINMGVLPNSWIRIQITYMGYTIVVETNSDVLGATFDKTAKKLDITVSGRSGTEGICNMTIPRPLLNSSSDIAFRLDNQPLNFTVRQDSNNYYIHAEYHHSTHDLSAQFMAGPAVQQKNEGSYSFIIMGTGIFIAGMLVMSILTVESIFVPIVTGIGMVFAPKKKKGDRELRGKILGMILASPGIHYRRIVRLSEAGNGGVSYHLHRLENEKQIYSKTEGLFKCYYPKRKIVSKKSRQRGNEAEAPDKNSIPALTEEPGKQPTVNQASLT